MTHSAPHMADERSPRSWRRAAALVAAVSAVAGSIVVSTWALAGTPSTTSSGGHPTSAGAVQARVAPSPSASSAPSAPATQPHIATPATSGPPPAVPAVTPLQKPPIPTTGAYLGAFVDPSSQPVTGYGSTSQELGQMGDLMGALGRPLAIVHVYQPWQVTVPNQTLAALASYGSIPMLDWNCGDNDANVIAGHDDALITGLALQLAAYGQPIFLRWYWEPNFPNSQKYSNCIGQLGPNGYVRAWQHIWRIFQAAGATNVAFVWNPGVAGNITDLSAYYPGSQYVDWVGIDGYDRDGSGASAFTSVFQYVYNQLDPLGKPMMVAETGASNDQPAFLSGVAQAMPTSFPDMKAFVYFDSYSGKNWSLTGAGLSAFAQLAQSPYFSAMP